MPGRRKPVRGRPKLHDSKAASKCSAIFANMFKISICLLLYLYTQACKVLAGTNIDVIRQHIKVQRGQGAMTQAIESCNEWLHSLNDALWCGHRGEHYLVIGRMVRSSAPPRDMGLLRDVPGRGTSAVASLSSNTSAMPYQQSVTDTCSGGSMQPRHSYHHEDCDHVFHTTPCTQQKQLESFIYRYDAK